MFTQVYSYLSVYSCLSTLVYLSLPLLNCVYPCFLVFTYVYHCSRVYLSLQQFNCVFFPVCRCLPVFTSVYTSLPILTTVDSCLPMFIHIYLRHSRYLPLYSCLLLFYMFILASLPMITHVLSFYLCLYLFTYVYPF